MNYNFEAENMKRFYKIRSKKYEFYATIQEYEHEHRIKFGGARQCINISIYPDNNIPNINGISYDSECSIGKDLHPGDGTIEMVKSALRFVKDLYPNTKEFMLKDHSKIKCKNKIEIPLYYYYITKYGKTWYQDKFGAKPYVKEERKHIKELVRFLKESPMLGIEEFDKVYVKASGCQLRNFADHFREEYESSRSYMEFLKNVISNNDCGILMNWFQYFMYKHSDFNFGEAFWVVKVGNDWDDVTYETIDSKPRFKSVHEGGFFPYGIVPAKP
jgi:hypothetical protein